MRNFEFGFFRFQLMEVPLKCFDAKHCNVFFKNAYCIASLIVFECFESSQPQKPPKNVHKQHQYDKLEIFWFSMFSGEIEAYFIDTNKMPTGHYFQMSMKRFKVPIHKSFQNFEKNGVKKVEN